LTAHLYSMLISDAQGKNPPPRLFTSPAVWFNIRGMATPRISRYILKEITVPTFVAMVIFCFVIVMGRLLQFMELVVNKHVPILEILVLFAHLLPTFMIIIIPFSLFLGILVGFGRLSSDSEIIALKSGGISLYGLARPVILLGLIGTLLAGWLNFSVQPRGRYAFDQKIFRLANSQISASIRPGIFNSDFQDLVIYAATLDENSGEMHNVFISENRSGNSPVIIVASAGRIFSDPDTMRMTLHLDHGSIHRRTLENGTENYQAARFGSYDLNLAMDQEDSAELKQPKKITRMTLVELKRAIDAQQEPRERLSMLTEFHKRLSLSLTPLVFALLGVPLGIQSTRSGKGGSFAKALGITVIYYILLTLARTVSQGGVIPPFIAMWLPNLLALTAGTYLFRLHAQEKRLEWLERLTFRIDDTFTRILARKNRQA